MDVMEYIKNKIAGSKEYLFSAFLFRYVWEEVHGADGRLVISN